MASTAQFMARSGRPDPDGPLAIVGPNARHGPQTEHGAKSRNRRIGRPCRKPRSCYRACKQFLQQVVSMDRVYSTTGSYIRVAQCDYFSVEEVMAAGGARYEVVQQGKGEKVIQLQQPAAAWWHRHTSQVGPASPPLGGKNNPPRLSSHWKLPVAKWAEHYATKGLFPRL